MVQADVDVNVNPNEVKSYRYLSKAALKDFLASAGEDCLIRGRAKNIFS